MDRSCLFNSAGLAVKAKQMNGRHTFMVINFSCKVSEAKVFRNSVMTIEFEINFLLPSLVNNLQDKN